jgi:hypothetical protein
MSRPWAMSVRPRRRQSSTTRNLLTQRIARLLLEQLGYLLDDAVVHRPLDWLHCLAVAALEQLLDGHRAVLVGKLLDFGRDLKALLTQTGNADENLSGPLLGTVMHSPKLNAKAVLRLAAQAHTECNRYAVRAGRG